MNSITLKNAVALAIATSSFILISGCQTPGRVVSIEESTVCPTCERQTMTTPIKGLKYKKHVCPQCKAMYGNDASETYGGIEDEMGVVHVCDYCKANVAACPQCRRQ